MKHLVTPRLLMRPFAESDFDDYFNLCSNPEIMKFIPPFRTLTFEEISGSFQKIRQNFSESDCGIFAVIERKEKRFIGFCGLHGIEPGNQQELHFAFITEFLLKTYAIEASMEILRAAFNDWALERVVAVVHSENRPCINVIERIGMQCLEHAEFSPNGMRFYSLEKPEETADSIFEHNYRNSPKLSLQQV